MKRRVTLKALAQTLGLSTQAVSLALRGQRGVSEATRERVKQEAARVGYAPDPGLRALADYRSMTREGAGRWKRVALVNNWPGPKALQEDSFYRLWKEELKKALRERGIALEDHWLGAEGEHTASVFRQLWHRGITGVFVAPPAFSEQPPALDLPRDRFEIVTFGPGHLFPDFHCVQFDFYENLRLAWKHLWQRGHRRIGLVYWEKQGWRTDHAWPAAFHIEQKLAGVPAGQLQPLILTTSAERKYRSWCKTEKPDAVISSAREIQRWDSGRRRPPALALFNVRQPGQSGIDLNLPQMARSAVELLLLEMRQSLVQQRDLPFRVHIPGKWVDG